MIFFDTNVIIHGIQNVGAPGEEAKSVMAKAYLAHLFESGVKLVLPTPALAEYLIGIPSEDHERTRLVLERNFLMAPLSAKAAQVAAQLLQAVDTRKMRAQHPVDRQSLRVDALIIGIAIDLQTSDGKAAKVVTYDLKHFRQLARGEIEVTDVPEVLEQPNLFE